jgi:hypothetical protein
MAASTTRGARPPFFSTNNRRSVRAAVAPLTKGNTQFRSVSPVADRQPFVRRIAVCPALAANA